jgi:hypothetical protein
MGSLIGAGLDIIGNNQFYKDWPVVWNVIAPFQETSASDEACGNCGEIH